MAQFFTRRNKFINNGDELFEVGMIATKDGAIVEASNPLPVTLGSENVTITGSVNIGTTVEISNDEGSPIPVHAHLFNQNDSEYSSSNPFTVQIVESGAVVSGTNGLPIRILNDPNLIGIARGRSLTAAEVDASYLIDKSGATESLGVTPADMTTVWDGSTLYPWTTFTGTGDKLYVSTTVDDPKLHSHALTIEGLDYNYNTVTETITLNATDSTIATATTQNFYRVVQAYLSGPDTNPIPNDQDIEIRYGSSVGTIVAQIQAYYGKTQSCTYTVPAGYEAFILSINGSSGAQDEITSMIWTKLFNDTWRQIKVFKYIAGSFEHNFRTPIKFPEKSDIELRAFALVESSRVANEFQLIVVPKP